MTRQPLRVAIVSRHELTRAGLTQLLTLDPRRAAVFPVPTVDGHLGRHDVAVYDLAGLVERRHDDLTRLLACGRPVIALEPTGRPDLAEGALTLGVTAVVGMDVSGPELLDLFERVAGGWSDTAADHLELRRARAQADAGLTNREMAILELIGRGVGNLDIAKALFLSINSVKSYIRSGYRKIGAASRSQAVLWVASRGLTASADLEDVDRRVRS